ncbi:MAG: hypothetical protein ACPGUV_15045, partial [Polyangiales bacterium]
MNAKPAAPRVPAPTMPSVRIAAAEGLNYLVAALGTDDEHANLPMLVAIHGLGYVPRFPEPEMTALGLPVRIVVLRGPETHKHGYGWYGVHVKEGRDAALAAALRERAAWIALALQRLQARYPTLGRPVVLGFSQGG